MTHFNFNQSLTNLVNNCKSLFILSLTLTTFGVGNVWGAYRTTVNVNSSPATGGYVHIGKSSGCGESSCTKTSHKEVQGKDGFKTSGSFTWYFCHKTNTNYVFKGWTTNQNANSGDGASSNPWVKSLDATISASSITGGNTYDYYAIFARMTADISSKDFGNVNVGQSSSATTITVTHAHASKITAALSGTNASDFSLSKTTIVDNSVSESTATFTVTFKPTCNGTRQATLTLSSTNGLNNVTISLSGTGVLNDQSLSWDNESAIELNMLNGTTQNISASASSKLAVSYSSNNPDVLSVDDTGKLTAKSVGDATITASQAGDCTYSAATSISKDFQVKTKDTPIFTPNWSSTNLKVGDKVTLGVQYVSDGLNGNFKAAYNSTIFNVTREGNTIIIEALNEGNASVTFTQIETDAIFSASKTYSFTVSKIANTLAADATYSMKVDETWNGVISGKNSDATVTTTTTDETVAYYDVTNNKIVAQNTNNQSFNSKEVTITISQAATYKYTAAEKTITVTVNKHVPTFTWSNATLYHNQSYNDFFTTNGTNALTVKSSSDDNVAYLVDGSNAQKLNLKTLSKAASTTLTVTQAENYYWAEHTETKIVTPKTVANHVPFTVTKEMYDALNDGTAGAQSWDNGIRVGDLGGGFNYDDKYREFGPFNGIPDKLSCSYTCSDAATSRDWRIYQSSDGSNWGNAIVSTSSAGSANNIQLAPTTRYLKFVYSGNFAGYFKDITVTELKTFSTDKSELDFGDTNKKDMPCADQTFTFNYANVGHKVSLSTSDNHFSVSPTSITNIGGEKYGSQTITVSYRTDEVHSTTNAKLTIKDELGNTKEVTLKGTTTKKVQTLTWNEPYDVAEPTIPIGKEITGAVTSSSNLGIIYESSDETIIEIAEDGKSFKAVKEGSATITAKQVGTDDWEATNSSKLFKTTNKIIQVISWNQNFTRLLTNYDSQDLTAKVYLVNAETGEQTYSKDRSDLISYSSQNTSVVSIENTTYGPRLSIIGKGSTTLTASVPGDDLYESATVTIPVTVRDPSAGCEDVLLPTDLTSEYEFWHFSYTSDMEKIVKIDRSSADYPGKMKFQHKGEKWGLSYSGNIDVYESTDNGATFPRYLGSVSPSVGNYQRSQEFALSRNATHLKFYRNEHATGYHYIKDIEIIPAQFIESDAVNNTIDFGNVTVNSVEGRTVTLSYANVKDNLTITKSSSYLTLSCGDIVDLDCGATGKEIITITFSPKAVGDFNDDITFFDKISKQNYAIAIKAKVVKSTQHITWEPTQTEYRTIDQIVLNATASSNNPVKYSVKEGADVADFVDNVLTIKKDGQVTITASEPGDAVWAAAVEVNKTFTIRKTNLHFEPLPTAATITYPQTLSESALTDGVVKDEDGNVIAGTIVWTNPTTQLNAGDNQTQDITFTPANNPVWYSSLSTAISLNVQKAVSDATPSAADITYGQKVDESILSNTGSTTGTWTWTDSRSADVLTAGVYTDLQVHFTPENNNYTELDATVSLTVNKAQPVISWTGETTYEWGEIANLFSASNNAAVTMTSLNETIAKIENNKIIPLIAGTVTIRGEIEENDNYLAASLDQTITINAPADNMFTNAAGDNDWNNPSNWTSGIVPEKLNDVDVIVSGEMTIDEEIHVNSLTIESGASVKVVVNGDLTVQGQSQERTEYGDLFVKNGGEVILPEGNSRKMMVHNLVIESSIGTSNGTSTSGQISNLEALAFDNGGDAYIDINLDPSGNADDSQWYCFTVPFPVDITTGIARKELDGSFKVLHDHTNFDILRYNPTQRLNTGKGWEYYHGTLQPGEFYLIAIDGTNNVYSFRKKKDADLISANTMSLAVNGDNTNVNANWNAVGNPTLQKVTASFSNKIVQVYVNGESRYQAVSTDDANFVVGCPFFIQASVAENLTLTADNSKSLFYAPARQDDNTNTLFCVRFGQNNHFSDQIFVTASEQALNQYEIGYDVAKIGVSKQSAQLWVNAYNQQLCAHEAVLTNDLADMALTLFAPKAGEYNLSVARENMPTDETLYLTQNGQIIWNLSESDYTIEAVKGDNNQYGLRLISSHRITTDNEQLESRNRAEKFIMNNQLYILRDGQLYDATGKKIQ